MKIISLLALAAAPALTAQFVLYGWDFDNGATGATQTVDFFDAGSVTTTDITAGGGLIIAGGTRGDTGWGSRNAISATPADALANDQFFSFTVNPTQALQLDELRLSVAVREAEANKGVTQYTLYSALDSFAAPVGSATSSPVADDDPVVYEILTINLGGLSVSSPTEFRLAANSSFSQGNIDPQFIVTWIGSDSAAFNDIQLTAVPEPSFYGLIAAFAALFLVYRRRHA